MAESTGSPQDARSRRNATAHADRIAVALAVSVALGLLVSWLIGQPGMVRPQEATNTFYIQYRRHEPTFLALTVAFALTTALVARRRGEPRAGSGLFDGLKWGSPQAAGAAALAFALAALGSRGVMHDFPLAMDEFVAVFQSRIFAAGRLSAPVPSEWQRFTAALQPIYVFAGSAGDHWASSYWPVYSMLRAIAVNGGLDVLVNPVLAALCVLLLHGACRRLWPGEPGRARLAIVFLISSSQFLFMSMTAFAMTADLCFNLAWLYAYSRNDRAGWIAAPVIGAIALGIHNPFPHALFVAPFLVQLLVRRRWMWAGYFGAVYLAGSAMWYAWMRSIPPVGGAAAVAQVFALPNLLTVGIQQLSLTLVFSWQTPIVAVLLIWVALAWRSLSETEWCLAAGVVLSFAFFFLFPRSQGHGWGYRYVFPVLGNIALLGASGAALMTEALGRATARRLIVASLLLTAFVQLPIRAWQIERYVRPFAELHEYVEHIDADVVIVDPTSSWYGIDLVRNDPFLSQRPKILSAYFLFPQDKRALAERFGSRVHMLQASEIARFGIPTYPSRYRKPIWPPQG